MNRNSSPATPALSSLYAYIFAMMASSAVTGLPILGGALYMCGRTAGMFFSRGEYPLEGRERRIRLGLLSAAGILSILLVIIYPMAQGVPKMWLMFVLVATMMVRDTLTAQVLSRLKEAGLHRTRRHIAWCQGVPAAAMAAILLYNLPSATALPLLGGYVLCGAVSAYETLRHPSLPPLGGEVLRGVKTIRRMNAFISFDRLSLAVSVAQEMTLVLLYTYLAATAQELLISMALALGVNFAFREAAAWLMRRRERAQVCDPTNMMLLGLLMWLWGLWSFSRALRGDEMVRAYTYWCLGLSSAASVWCSACLERMEQAVGNAAEFAQEGSDGAYRTIRRGSAQLAQLLGRLLALCALTVLCFVTGREGADLTHFAASFHPVLALPALLMVVLSILSALRFPLSSRYIHKLSRFLTIRKEGGENPSLHKQLEDVVVHPHRQPFGTRVIMALIRPLFRHRLKGAENIVQDENNPIVFLCNHGEIYGPVSGMLYIPVPVRPWVMSEITQDPLEVAEYVYKWSISPIKWLGRAGWWLARLIGPVAVWAMRQFEAIPVYRNKPRELMTTFRRSVEAMEAGDNLLIFPENPDAVEGEGYAQGKMGTLFRGFPMLAQVYYNRTGKRCRFLPMYAHQGCRTLSFGTPILFDPDNDTIAERDRIVEEAQSQMEALFRREEEIYQQKKAGKGISS